LETRPFEIPSHVFPFKPLTGFSSTCFSSLSSPDCICNCISRDQRATTGGTPIEDAADEDDENQDGEDPPSKHTSPVPETQPTASKSAITEPAAAEPAVNGSAADTGEAV
ncbi:hypothetical protein KCU95_g1586, partial [Aureobasidium melanogenum]